MKIVYKAVIVYAHARNIVCGPCDTRDAAARLAELAIKARGPGAIDEVRIDEEHAPNG